jgi:hypothetical protein
LLPEGPAVAEHASLPGCAHEHKHDGRMQPTAISHAPKDVSVDGSQPAADSAYGTSHDGIDMLPPPGWLQAGGQVKQALDNLTADNHTSAALEQAGNVCHVQSRPVWISDTGILTADSTASASLKRGSSQVSLLANRPERPQRFKGKSERVNRQRASFSTQVCL